MNGTPSRHTRIAQAAEDPTEEEELSPSAQTTSNSTGQRRPSAETNLAEPTNDALLPHTQLSTSDSGALPGLQAFASLGSIAPFMTLWQLYATHHYPDETEPVGKYHCFTRDHKWVVRWCFFMDFLIRFVLVVLVLIVILRGLSLWPESLNWGQ